MNCDIDLATNVAARLSLYKFKDIEFFTQKLIIPGIRAVYPKIQAPRLAVAMPPQSIVYEPFVLTYLLKEDMSNHKSLINWLQDAITEKGENVFSDASVFILSAQRTVVSEIKFLGMMPIDISGIEYVTTADTTVYQQATVTFDYLQYKYV